MHGFACLFVSREVGRGRRDGLAGGEYMGREDGGGRVNREGGVGRGVSMDAVADDVVAVKKQVLFLEQKRGGK